MRAMTSLALPAVSGTTTLMVLVGQSWVKPSLESAPNRIANANASRCMFCPRKEKPRRDCTGAVSAAAMAAMLWRYASGHLVDEFADAFDPHPCGVARLEELAACGAD